MFIIKALTQDFEDIEEAVDDFKVIYQDTTDRSNALKETHTYALTFTGSKAFHTLS